MDEFYISLYVPDHLSKKNNRPIWRGRLGKSQKLRDVENYLTAAFKKELGSRPTIKGPVWVKFIFHTTKYWTKKKQRNKKMGDLVNLIQLPADCLESAGVIEDDTNIISMDGSRRLPSDHNRLEICVLSVPELDNG